MTNENKIRRLYPDDTEIDLIDCTVLLTFTDRKIAADFYELMEAFRGRLIRVGAEDTPQ